MNVSLAFVEFYAMHVKDATKPTLLDARRVMLETLSPLSYEKIHRSRYHNAMLCVTTECHQGRPRHFVLSHGTAINLKTLKLEHRKQGFAIHVKLLKYYLLRGTPEEEPRRSRKECM